MTYPHSNVQRFWRFLEFRWLLLFNYLNRLSSFLSLLKRSTFMEVLGLQMASLVQLSEQVEFICRSSQTFNVYGGTWSSDGFSCSTI